MRKIMRTFILSILAPFALLAQGGVQVVPNNVGASYPIINQNFTWLNTNKVGPDKLIAPNITYTAPGAGVVSETIQSVMDQTIRVSSYRHSGDTSDSPSFQRAHDALPLAGGTIIVPDSSGYVLASQITITKPVIWRIGNTTITGPTSGYMFENQAAGGGIEGAGGGTILKMSAGSSGAIHQVSVGGVASVNQNHYWNFSIDPNNVGNANALFLDGGWYVNVQNVHINKGTTPSTTWGLHVKSSPGNYSGSFVGQFTNLVSDSVFLEGTSIASVTTLLFTTLDASHVIGSWCDSIGFINHVIQSTTGSWFTFTNSHKLSFIAGYGEGNPPGGAYNFDTGTTNVFSAGNFYITSVYFSAVNPNFLNGLFLDWTGNNTEFGLMYGLQSGFKFQGASATTRHWVGPSLGDPDNAFIGSNMELITGNQAILYDPTKGGSSIELTPLGFNIYNFSAGTNPRTGQKILSSNGSVISSGLPISPVVRTPSGPTDTCASGATYADGNYLYFCPAANYWVRGVMNTWTPGQTNITFNIGTPASSTAACSPGAVLFDGGYMYFCAASGYWVRTATSHW